MPISAAKVLNPRSHLYFLSPRYILPPEYYSLKPPTILSLKFSTNRRIESVITRQWQLRTYETNSTTTLVQREDIDIFLSIGELICIVPSAVLSIGCVVNWSFLNSQKSILLKRVLIWQLGLLVGAVVIGGLIRRRQWGKICGGSLNSSGGVSKLDLVGRIEKLEEDLRCSTTIIRMLSRQLEKLGIRFRVTRKSLKEPITEAAALAQKNSEATQTLQMQKDILEKELGEIQNVLLAMQEQQKKQLELILAVVKAGKLSKRESVVESLTQNSSSVPVNNEEKQVENQTTTGGRQKIANNDSA